jgi:hypothetical protein
VKTRARWLGSSRSSAIAPHFAAAGSRFHLEGTDIGLPAETMKLLELSPGDSVGVLPF